jgi:hypothetical protein
MREPAQCKRRIMRASESRANREVHAKDLVELKGNAALIVHRRKRYVKAEKRMRYIPLKRIAPSQLPNEGEKQDL